MQKFLGALLVTAASMMSGWAARQGLRQRLSQLRQLRLALELMQGELELHMPAVAQLFETVGNRLEGGLGAFFLGTAVQMTAVTGRPPKTAMKLQLEEQNLNLGDEEKAMLLELGGTLGRYDLEGQARTLELYKRRLDERIEAESQTFRQRSKAWMTASVCTGLMLVVLML
jgi:stage III sporulation protein AB